MPSDAPDEDERCPGHVERMAVARAFLDSQHGVASRRQLFGLGLRRWELRAELKAGRWMRLGPQTVCGHTGALTDAAQWWAAVLEVGSGAALDGVTALLAAGLTGYEEDVLHVSIPKSGRP